MTRVSMEQLVLSDAADPSVAVAVTMLAGSGDSWPAASAGTVLMAAGRTRAGGGLRGGRTWTPQVGRMNVATARWLQARAGLVHWARDPIGGKVACKWDDAPITWRGAEGDDGQPTGEQMATVALTLLEVTHAEVPAGAPR